MPNVQHEAGNLNRSSIFSRSRGGATHKRKIIEMKLPISRKNVHVGHAVMDTQHIKYRVHVVLLSVCRCRRRHRHANDRRTPTPPCAHRNQLISPPAFCQHLPPSLSLSLSLPHSFSLLYKDTDIDISHQVLGVGEPRALVLGLGLRLALGHANRLPVDGDHDILGRIGLLAPTRHDRVVPLFHRHR